MSQKQDNQKISFADGQGTTDLRVPLNLSVLSEWIVQQPALTSLLSEANKNWSQQNVSDPQFLHQHLSVTQFGFGQSNPTFLVSILASAEKKNSPSSSAVVVKWVLRKKPDKVA